MLREASLLAEPTIDAERALIVTRYLAGMDERVPAPLLRAGAYAELCERKTLYIGDGELIVGERGPAPKRVSTFPELTCHSLDDLRILSGRAKTRYAVPDSVLAAYESEVIPFWKGRSQRERIFAALPDEWKAAYGAGVFTEFMEQRAPGHTVADGKIYERGMEDLIVDVDARLSGESDGAKRAQLEAMRISAEATIRFAERHARLARERAAAEADPGRRAELERIAAVCERVPAQPPRDFHEALQTYWFCHLGVITELNGWDAYSPGHLDQHLEPFYGAGLADGTLTREGARELLECFFVKFNNHTAPPKVGVTAAESGTYTDFANIGLGGLRADGSEGSSELSHLLLEVIADMHLLQPSTNVQISRETADEFLDAACGVIREGYGFPSVFNSDLVVEEMLRQGKSLADAREGGTSGCVETGAFGKEAYILTGYFNLPKLLELALHDGVDPRSGERIGPATGDPARFASFADLFAAWKAQLEHFAQIKLRGNAIIEKLYAERMPAPFLSLITSDCIEKGLDYNAGGARYNTSYIQGVGIGTLTDCFAAIRRHVYGTGELTLPELIAALAADFAGAEPLRQKLRNRSPKWGNDDDAADELMRAAFEAFFAAVDGRPNERGGSYHVNMLPTTCHVYFGQVLGATPDGRRAGLPLSEGISPVQGMDRQGPTAVLLSMAKMDQVRTGGTLLNMKFVPQVLEGETGLARLRDLIRGYFRLGGHHVQFNVVDAATLRRAQADPESHGDLIVRVAGYSDSFRDRPRTLQDEISSRTEQPASSPPAPRPPGWTGGLARAQAAADCRNLISVNL